jgi:membrane-anchored protein YejM (alkaline phosphatase superfamily)
MPSNLELMDDKLHETLEQMLIDGVFDETVVIIMGDHGNRLGAIQNW